MYNPFIHMLLMTGAATRAASECLNTKRKLARTNKATGKAKSKRS